MNEYRKCMYCRRILRPDEVPGHYHVGDPTGNPCEWNGKEPDEHGCLDCTCGEHVHSWEELVRHLRDGMTAGERANPETAIAVQATLAKGDGSEGGG